MRNLMAGALFALSLSSTAYAAIQEEAVTYKDGDTVMKGFVVYDNAKKGKRPGIVVVHEWWGITAHTREEARKFAAQGYTAFVADMYGERKTADNPTDAGGLMKGLWAILRACNRASMPRRPSSRSTPPWMRKRSAPPGTAWAARSCSTWRAPAPTSRVSPRSSQPLGAEAGRGRVRQGKVIVLNGADDPFVKPDSIEAFKKEMDGAKVN